MRIGAKSASASVLRTLEAIIAASGHTVANASTGVDHLLVDTLHPPHYSDDAATKLLLVKPGDTPEGAIICPLRPERLIQRLAMLGAIQSVALANGWKLDMLARNLHHATGISCALTEKECSLLNHLTQSHPVQMARDTLLEQVWGVHGNVDTHTLETHIYRLRAKLNELTPHPVDIVTQGGAYALVFGANPG